jgi:hypothetical protein
MKGNILRKWQEYANRPWLRPTGSDSTTNKSLSSWKVWLRIKSIVSTTPITSKLLCWGRILKRNQVILYRCKKKSEPKRRNSSKRLLINRLKSHDCRLKLMNTRINWTSKRYLRGTMRIKQRLANEVTQFSKVTTNLFKRSTLNW